MNFSSSQEVPGYSSEHQGQVPTVKPSIIYRQIQVCLFVKKFSFFTFICFSAHVYVYGHLHQGEYVEVKGELGGVGSLLPPCGFQSSNSGCQACRKVPLPAQLLIGLFVLFAESGSHVLQAAMQLRLALNSRSSWPHFSNTGNTGCTINPA